MGKLGKYSLAASHSLSLSLGTNMRRRGSLEGSFQFFVITGATTKQREFSPPRVTLGSLAFHSICGSILQGVHNYSPRRQHLEKFSNSHATGPITTGHRSSSQFHHQSLFDMPPSLSPQILRQLVQVLAYMHLNSNLKRRQS